MNLHSIGDALMVVGVIILIIGLPLAFWYSRNVLGQASDR